MSNGLYYAVDFRFKKSLGQNFIFDEGLLTAVVSKLGLDKSDTVLEVGTGAGTLTTVLAKHAGRVITFEIDNRLAPTLTQRFSQSGAFPPTPPLTSQKTTDKNNITLIFADIMKTPDDELCRLTNGEPFKLIANIPYYITSPLLLRFIRNPACREICVLVQEEVAKRIIAKPGGKDYGALSVTMQTAADCTLIKRVPRTVFVPQPQVDSAFIKCKMQSAKRNITDIALFDKLAKAMFAARRKTVLNALCTCFPMLARQTASGILSSLHISETVRPETLLPDQFISLANEMAKPEQFRQ